MAKAYHSPQKESAACEPDHLNGGELFLWVIAPYALKDYSNTRDHVEMAYKVRHVPSRCFGDAA